MNSQLDNINKEIEIIDQSIAKLRRKRNELLNTKKQVMDQLARQLASEDTITSTNYDTHNFPWSERLTQLAQQHFNIHQFRTLQLPILNAVLEDKHDLFVVLPTGAGKSLCYQLPALLENSDRFTLVISPLVSLIKDQVYHLKESNVQAEYLVGSSSKEKVASIQQSMVPQKKNQSRPNPFRLLYVTPEKIAKSKRFMAVLNKAYDANMISRIVVDEAHCCSQQGHDFRPDYKQLNILRVREPTFFFLEKKKLSTTCLRLFFQKRVSQH